MEVFTDLAHIDSTFNSTRYFLHDLDLKKTLTSEGYFHRMLKNFLYLLEDIKNNPQSMARVYIKDYIKQNQNLFWFLKIAHLYHNLHVLHRVLPFNSIMPHAQSEFSARNNLFSFVFYNDYYGNYCFDLNYPSFMDFKFHADLKTLKVEKCIKDYTDNKFNMVFDAESPITTYIINSIDILMFEEVFNFSPYIIWQNLHKEGKNENLGRI